MSEVFIYILNHLLMIHVRFILKITTMLGTICTFEEKLKIQFHEYLENVYFSETYIAKNFEVHNFYVRLLISFISHS